MTAVDRKNIAIIGATGLVGRTIARVLEERRFPVGELVPIATKASSERGIDAFGKRWLVQTPGDVDFETIDYCFFTAGARVSSEHVPLALKAGCRIIDNTTAFRMDPDVPLVVPEINGHMVTAETRLVACPNCTTIILVMTLAPFLSRTEIDRVVLTALQSVSGAGREAVDELNNQTADSQVEANVFSQPIAFNCLPQVGTIESSGFTREEEKIVEETRKILGREQLSVVPTSVRVPVRIGHSISINIETTSPVDVDSFAQLMRETVGVRFEEEIPTPLGSAGKDDVMVGRVRQDLTRKNALSYWAVGDNLRKGAATNSVQIAELFLRHRP